MLKYALKNNARFKENHHKVLYCNLLIALILKKHKKNFYKNCDSH